MCIMKNIFKILSLSSLVLLGACSKEYEAPTAEYAFPFSSTNVKSKMKANLDTEYAFSDLSLGVNSRAWRFGTLNEGVIVDSLSNGDKVQYTGEELDSRVTFTDDYSDYVTFVEGDQLSDQVVVKFTKPGVCVVNLRNTLVDPSLNLDISYPVNVLDSIQLSFIGKSADLENPETDTIRFDSKVDPSISLEAGSEVIFESTTLGLPTDYEWTLDGSDEGVVTNKLWLDTDVIQATAHYYVPGTYDVQIIGSRTEPWGQDTLVLENYITITPSNKSASVASIEQTEDESLILYCTLPLKTETISADKFSVTRNGAPVEVTSLKAVTGFSTRMEMEIDGGAWNGDEILVSYTGGIKTLVDTDLEAFTDMAFTPLIVNLIPNGDLELDTDLPLLYSGWDVVSDPATLSLSTEIFQSGLRSMKYVQQPGSGLVIRSNPTADFVLEAGKQYMFEYSFYGIVAGRWAQCMLEGRPTWFDFGISSNACWVGSVGEWTKQAKVFTMPETAPAGNTYFWNFQPDGNGMEVYLDDFMVYEYKKHE